MAVLCLLTNTPWPWPTPARAASATERGITHLEQSGRPSQTGLHKRSAEDWGDSLRAPGAELLRSFGFLAGRGAQELLLGSALRAVTGPQRWVAEDRTGRSQGGGFLPQVGGAIQHEASSGRTRCLYTLCTRELKSKQPRFTVCIGPAAPCLKCAYGVTIHCIQIGLDCLAGCIFQPHRASCTGFRSIKQGVLNFSHGSQTSHPS